MEPDPSEALRGLLLDHPWLEEKVRRRALALIDELEQGQLTTRNETR